MIVETAGLIRQSIKDRIEEAKAGKLITWEEWESTSCNFYERNALLEFVDNECLCKLSKHALDNCWSRTNDYPTTYEEAVIAKYFPLLIERLQATKPQALPIVPDFKHDNKLIPPTRHSNAK